MRRTWSITGTHAFGHSTYTSNKLETLSEAVSHAAEEFWVGDSMSTYTLTVLAVTPGEVEPILSVEERLKRLEKRAGL